LARSIGGYHAGVAVAAVVAACGALVVAASLAVLRDPAGAAATAVADRTGVEPVAPDAVLTAGPVVATAVGALVVLLALLLLRAPGDWRTRSRRHEVPGGAAAPGAGEGPAASGPSAGRPTGPPATAGAAPDDDGRADWDALSRGDDPS
ncbi:Trp biosynthesis-associated membrane protein, partial [Cellulomonas sp. 179-A 9B4 NHS]|uniref:Trp biosynthesis-associated membrane protein n=1 Tax=Cellulomonas sp. 179-A 9B4 NHS TaxID=3142379 RepID=UPI0039A32F17